ncbi:MAG: four-carbon acid sugar kinase family protein [Acidobacteriota bacterium]
MQRIVADDFSGAAEVAGVGFRYGLRAAVQLDTRTTASCELAVWDTDSRSKPLPDAVGLVQAVLDQGDCIFKKIDSVLRGHVLAEIQPFLHTGRYSRALVVPFNPDLGRTIEDGIYRVNGRPISQTLFRDDPEYPALTSDVWAMLGQGGRAARVCRLSDALPDTGIVIGEGATHQDLRAWAERVDRHTLPVGGAPFFAAWLESGGRVARGRCCAEAGSRVLVVSGTASRIVDWRAARGDGNVRVLPMPEAVFERGSPESLMDWANDVAQALHGTNFVVVSVGGGRLLDRSQSARLVRHLAELASFVLARSSVDQLWLEGGATASAIIRSMRWVSLGVVGELAPGVVQLRPVSGGPLITVKPGSYPWHGVSQKGAD